MVVDCRIGAPEEKISSAGLVRAQQVNESVARNAHRWIFHHPDDEPLSELALPPIEEIAAETVVQYRNPDRITAQAHIRARRYLSSLRKFELASHALHEPFHAIS